MALTLEEMLTRRPVDEKRVAEHVARMKLALAAVQYRHG